LWTGLDILGLPHKKTMTDQASKVFNVESLRQALRLRTGSIFLTSLTGLTIVSGALVAGNDAGRAYKTFPKMDDEWIPSEIADLTPWYRNLKENSATVQFNHRILGMSTAVVAFGLAGLSLASPVKAKSVAIFTPQVRMGVYAVATTSLGQMLLGITTLLQYVPLSLAAAHQVGSIVVFSSGIYLTHSLRYARPALARLRSNNALTKEGTKKMVPKMT